MTDRSTPHVPAPTIALAVAHAGCDFAQGAIPAIGAVLASRGTIDLAQIGILVFAVNAGSSALQPALGIIADRTTWPWTAVAGVLIAAIGLAGLGAAPGFTGMLAATTLCGIGIAAFHPEAGRLVRATTTPDIATRAMSVFALGGNIGFAIGPLVAAPVALAAGGRGIAGLAVIPAAAAAPLIWIIATHRRRPTPSESTPAATTPDMWRPFTILGAVITLRSAGYYSLQAFAPALLITTFSISTSAGTQGLTVLVVAGTAATMLGGWRARRTPSMTLISWPLAVVATATAALIAAPTYPMALIILAIIGAATFAGFSPSITLAQNYLPGRAALASAVGLGLAPGIGSAIAIPITQIAQHVGYTPALAILAALPLVALILALRLPVAATEPETTSTAA